MSLFFYTESGLKINAVSTAEMIEIDRLAIEKYGPNLFQMMENAGRSLALTILNSISKIINPKIVILAGTGGNGGGGICAARHLKNRGIDVSIVLTDERGLSDISKEQLKIFKNSGGRIDEEPIEQDIDLIVDAIIGYNLAGAPRGKVKKYIEWANNKSAIKISLDVPSGIDSATGEKPGIFFTPDITMTLALPKTGLSQSNCGALLLADIGIPEKVFKEACIAYAHPFKDNFIIKLREHR